MPEPDSLTTIATLTPDAVAVHDPDDPSRTFAELEAHANRLANALVGLGVRPGDRVAWCGPNSTEVPLALHASRTIGATTVPVSYRFTADELRYVLDDCGCAVVLVDAANADRVADLPEHRHVIG